MIIEDFGWILEALNEVVGTLKIGKLSAKGIKYLQLRLPKSCSRIIGNIAHIFDTEHNGKIAFLIVIEQIMSNSDMILNLKPKF
jgi:hypothetical protein